MSDRIGYGWGLAAALLLLGCREIAGPERYRRLLTICRTTLTATGVGPLTCERDRCMVTRLPDGSREYVCETHHFIIGPGGTITWL